MDGSDKVACVFILAVLAIVITISTYLAIVTVNGQTAIDNMVKNGANPIAATCAMDMSTGKCRGLCARYIDAQK